MTMTAAEVLAASARQLFPGDEADTKSRFRILARQFHPDVARDGGSPDVMAHVVRMRDVALNSPRLQSAGFTVARTGKKLVFPYLSRHKWEAGEIFVTASSVVYRVDPVFADLAYAAQQVQWKFRDDRMREKLEPVLPLLARVVETETEGKIMIYSRDQGQVLLADLVQRLEGPIGSAHAAWMISSLLSLCTYLYVSELTHYGLTLETLTVNVETHEIRLAGPPLYMASGSSRPNAVPAHVLARYPGLRDRKKTPPLYVADTQQVRSMVMDLLRVNDIASLRNVKDLSPGVAEFLSSAPEKSTLDDYRKWEKMRGKGVFVKYDQERPEYA